MNKLKKFFLYIFFLIFIFAFILSIFYAFLIYKPNQTLKIIDKALLYNYSVDVKFIDSNKSLLKPNFLIEEITLKNRNSDEIVHIPKLKIGVNIYESLTQPYLSLSILEIDSIRLSEGNSGEVSEPFLIKGSNLKISNNDLQIESKSFSLLFSKENSKAIFHQGVINSYSFVHIEALFDPSSESIYYSSEHSFDSKTITDRNLVNLEDFKSHDIDLGFSTKGIFNFGTKDSIRFDRLVFKNSKLVNKSGYIIDKIDATIFTGKNSMYGLFNSQIPNQMIKGALEVNNNKNFIVRTDIAVDMSTLINSNRYFDISGYEIFNTVMTITQEKTSMKLLSDLMNTKISSSINEIKKETNEFLKTQIYIDNISKPIYEIKNNNIESLIDSKGYGFFSFGKGFKEVIKKTEHKNGFYVYLNLKEIDLNNIFFDSSDSDNSSLKSIKMKSKKFNFLNNTYLNQYFDVMFEDETIIKMIGESLNGTINIDQTNFVKIKLNNTKFNFNGIDLAQSSLPSDINNISLRFIGKNIRTEDDLFQDIDFYLLRNKMY